MSKDIDTIFRRAKHGQALFLDRDVLSADYVPTNLPFRQEQLNSIAEVLAPILHGSKPSNLLLYGKTGTGKTAVTRFVLDRLREEIPKTGLITPFINTRMAVTEYRTLREFGAQIGLSLKDLPETGLSIGLLVDRIFNKIKDDSSKVILVLDEIDHLVSAYGDDILYEFTRAGERLGSGMLSLVGISNSLNFKEALDPRVLSSLGEEELIFPPYTVNELRSILADRAKLAFKSHVVPDSTINLCAAMAGSEHGDARRAVDLLRIAGEVAERSGLQTIDESCLKKASAKADQDRTDELLHSLPPQDKLILATISKFDKGTSTGEVYSMYSILAKKTGLEVLTQRRVSGILAELDLLGLIQAAVISQGRRGRTKRIKLLLDTLTLAKMLEEDETFAELA